jgi:hypothetical protein
VGANNGYPATLSFLSDLGLHRATVRVVGYGNKQFDEMYRIMETVEMTIISRRECENRILKIQEEKFSITEQYLCGIGTPHVIMTHVCIYKPIK